MIDVVISIINFDMTQSLIANYVLNIILTVLVKAVLPVKIVKVILDRGLKWST